MKKKSCILLLIVLFQMLVSTTCFANTSIITLKVNNLVYTPKYSIKYVNDTLYISAEDLAAMTYGTYHKQDKGTLITIQSKDILLSTTPSCYIKLSGKSIILSKKTLLENDILYLPIDIFNILKYPYTWTNNTFNLNTISPYSLATDTYNTHTYLQTPYQTLDEALSSLLDTHTATNLIKSCYLNNQYISFISTSNKKESLATLTKMVHSQKQNYTVSFRKILPNKTGFTISSLIHYPLTYEIKDNSLLLHVNQKTLSNSCFWATYNPLTKSTKLDLNKSLDVMLMRSLYEYYRDLYHFKDDLNTLPLIKVQMGRSDSISYKVYMEHGTVKNYYTITIYKQNSSKNVHYYVDIALFS